MFSATSFSPTSFKSVDSFVFIGLVSGGPLPFPWRRRGRR